MTVFNLKVNDLCVDGPLAKYLDLKGSPLIGDIKHMADKKTEFSHVAVHPEILVRGAKVTAGASQGTPIPILIWCSHPHACACAQPPAP